MKTAFQYLRFDQRVGSHVTLYHFTCLYNLSDIMREGLTKGEVPIGPDDIRQAPNLTSNPNPEALMLAASISAGTDKSKVRLTISVPKHDNRLENWRDVCRSLKTERFWRRGLDHYGQSKFWFIYWGIIPVDWIQAVEIRDKSGFVVYANDRLAELIKSIEDERVGLEMRGDSIVIPSDREDSWLLDGPDMKGKRA
jgi:hypothetical protein